MTDEITLKWCSVGLATHPLTFKKKKNIYIYIN